MTSKLVLSYVDYDEETSSVGVRGVDFTAANFDAQVALQDALVTAISGVTIANQYKTQRIAAAVETAKTLPTDPYAQRETKWLVRYTDNVNSNGDGSFEIPGADLSLLITNGKTMDVSAGAGAAFVTAFEAYARSKLGNAVTFVSATHVGRNT